LIARESKIIDEPNRSGSQSATTSAQRPHQTLGNVT